MEFKSTKVYRNLPCSHQQWKDSDSSGEDLTGVCSRTHGYSRSFHFEFSCSELDDYGWVVGFSSLKKVSKWLDYMFDHTSLWEAGDPRLEEVIKFNNKHGIYNMRILPSGVSMEQTSIFVSAVVNQYLLKETQGRCFVSKLEVRENDKNSAFLEMSRSDAEKLSRYQNSISKECFPLLTRYEYISPKDLIELIENS